MPQLAIDSFKNIPGEENHLLNWIFENIQPYIKGRVLGINVTTNSIVPILIQHGISLHVSNSNESLRQSLFQQFQGLPAVKSIQNINFFCPEFKQLYPTHLGVFYTIISLNFTNNYSPIEIENIKHCLRKNGRLIVVLPIEITAFPGLELEISQLRQHSKPQIIKLFSQFEVLKIRYFELTQAPTHSQTFSNLCFALVVAKSV